MERKISFEKYICAGTDRCELYNHVNAPLLRKEFTVENTSDAALYITALGFYRVFLNGVEITKGKLAPYVSNPKHIVCYDEYDVSSVLNKGKNVISVILGNGFYNCMGGYPWGFDKADWRGSPKLALKIYFGEKCVVSADSTFKTHGSHVTFDDLRCGEYVDFNQYEEKRFSAGYDDGEWRGALECAAPEGELVPCRVNPVKIKAEEYPVSMHVSDGGMIFDFGTNRSGVCRIKFKGVKGQKITVWHFEALLENNTFYNKNTCTPDFDRNLSQKDVFISNGEENVFEPWFTFHGFRYVFVEGIYPYVAEKDFITRLVLHSDFPIYNYFSCSDETVNKLQEMVVISDKSNFFYYPLDCPQREKNGWTADAALSAEQFLYNFDCSAELNFWLDNIIKAQTEAGALPGVVPTYDFGYSWGNGPGWDQVLVELPYQLYRFQGDTSAVERSAEAIVKYFVYLRSKLNGDGLVDFGLCDWCETGTFSEGDASTPVEVTDTLTAISMLNKCEFMFSAVGEKEKTAYVTHLRGELINAFTKKYVEGSAVTCFTQTAQAMAISVGLFDNCIRQAVNALMDMIKRDNGTFKVGVLGARVLFRVLAENGYAEKALDLITQDKFPSYKYWIDHGATSLWEAFNETYDNSVLRRDGGRTLSLNHHFWGDISAFFYKYILGVNVNPNGDDDSFVEIRKCEISSVLWAKGKYENKNGALFVSWQKDANGEIVFNIERKGDIRYVVKR